MVIAQLNNPLDVAAAVITVLTAAILIKQVVVPTARGIHNFFKTIGQFLSDWSGHEERPGFPGVPGVMERINRIDGQLRNNGGSSLKDAIDRIEEKVHKIDDRLDNGDKEFEIIYDEIETLKAIVERRKNSIPVQHDRRATHDNDSKPE